MKHVILFDMDGTLTPTRGKMTWEMSLCLKDLSKLAGIGIVTGSGMDYLEEQCSILWESVDPSLVTLMPCNGTQVHKWKNGVFERIFSVDMRKKMGNDKFDKLMEGLIFNQFMYCFSSECDHALTGHFISYRESMINWCPVGRNATRDQRLDFIHSDSVSNTRERLKDKIELYLRLHDIYDVAFSLGGSTSIDIYPVGWDKTYSLNHYGDSTCWFVGDKCTNNGNDRTIYEKLNKVNRSFQTNEPDNTIDIIDTIIKEIKGE